MIIGFGGNNRGGGGGRNWNNHDDRGSYGRDGGRDRGYGKYSINQLFRVNTVIVLRSSFLPESMI